MYDKQAIYDLLKEKGIWYDVVEHPAVFDMEALGELDLPHAEYNAKNLFVRDDKKRNYYLITVRGEKRVDLKDFRKKQGTRRLSFASPEDMEALLGLTPGSVSPLGLLNDREHRVHYYLDQDLAGEEALVGMHPNENTASIWLKSADLIALIQEHGNEVTVVEI